MRICIWGCVRLLYGYGYEHGVDCDYDYVHGYGHGDYYCYDMSTVMVMSTTMHIVIHIRIVMMRDMAILMIITMRGAMFTSMVMNMRIIMVVVV